MTPQDELRAWNAVTAAVLTRDIENGKASAYPDVPEIESPLLRACMDARNALERIVRDGGHWRGEWVSAERVPRQRTAVLRG